MVNPASNTIHPRDTSLPWPTAKPPTGFSVGWGGSIRPITTMANTATAIAPLRYPTRQLVSWVTMPIVLTPISNPNAHDTSMSPVTRPRRSKGTWPAIHEHSEIEGAVAQTEDDERGGEHRYALSGGGKARAGEHGAHSGGHGPARTEAIDDPPDQW